MQSVDEQKQAVRVEEDGSILFERGRYISHPKDSGHITLLGKKGKFVWVVRQYVDHALTVWDQLGNVICRVYRDDCASLYESSNDVELAATDEAGDVVTICVPVSALDRWWSALEAGEKAEIFSSHMSYLDALEAPAETAVQA